METADHMAVRSGAPALALHILHGLPMIEEGDDLAALLIEALEAEGLWLHERDVLVVAQKIVSKAEGRMIDLADVTPSAVARRLAQETGKDARFLELVLAESTEVVKARPGLVVAAHRRGQIMANAGIDQSNIGEADGTARALLLPRDADASADALRARLEAHFSCRIGLVVSDSFGRPWRRGTVGVALGVSGLPSVIDLRGKPDLFGRVLQVTEIGYADEIAAAASLLMGQADEGRPAILIRGLDWNAPESDGASICRDKAQDMFR